MRGPRLRPLRGQRRRKRPELCHSLIELPSVGERAAEGWRDEEDTLVSSRVVPDRIAMIGFRSGEVARVTAHMMQVPKSFWSSTPASRAQRRTYGIADAVAVRLACGHGADGYPPGGWVQDPRRIGCGW